MADSGVEVAPSVVEEVGEEIKASGGAESPQLDEYDAASDEIVPAAAIHKRKLEDLEPSDRAEVAPAKKQEALTEIPSLSAAEPGSGDGEVAGGAPVEDSDEVKAGHAENGDEKLEVSEAVEVEMGDQGEHQAGTDGMENGDEKLEVSEAVEVEMDDQVEQQAGNDGMENGDKKVEVSEAVEVDMDDQVEQQAGTDGMVPAENELRESEIQTDENGNIPSEKNVESIASPPVDVDIVSRKIEVPNNKVGVLIGKAGETIRYLQFNSGAKIQITRDAEADPNSTARPVELIGSLESINKAEKFIKEVIAEAEAGVSPSLVVRGFGTLQSGGEQFEIKVANEKVGLIIGKGGATIKNLQTRSGARIQLIPHLPEGGDASKERIVSITGDKRQVESAKDMIKDLMNQTPRLSHLSDHNQQNYRSQSQWKAQETSPAQRGGYDYQQRGAYPPPQSVQYSQPYGGYSQQSAPQGGFGSSGWDQRSSAPVHNAPAGAYDYYGHGGPTSGMQASIPNSMSGPSPPMNYGQSQPPNYGHPAPYGQPGPTQQNYDQGYNDQQLYAQQMMGSQPNSYSQGSVHSGYNQQPLYNKQAYGAPQEGLPSYGVPPRANQPGDPTYHGYAPSYGSGTQQYPYGYNAASQPAPVYNQTYGPAPGATDGYGQPPPSAYTQHGVQAAAPGYGQVGQQAPAYSQPTSQVSAHGHYPTPQQGYTDPASGNTNYGYHGGPQAAYGNNIPAFGYATVPVASNPSGYHDQTTAPQAG